MNQFSATKELISNQLVVAARHKWTFIDNLFYIYIFVSVLFFGGGWGDFTYLSVKNKSWT